jgi:hypothetical protein
VPVEIKPLFRPEVIARAARQFHADLPETTRAKLNVWANALRHERFEGKETELLPQFLVDVFVDVLGYEPAPGRNGRHTISREQHVEVDGEFADACLGRFGAGADPSGHPADITEHGHRQFEIVVEGKGPRDPLDRPHGGRRRSAVEQVYDYAVGLGCNWMIVTNIREVRLYSKLSDKLTYERFDVVQLADDPALLRRFVFLLGAPRVLPDAVLGAAAPAGAENHLYALRADSERAGRELTADYYDQYATLRREVFAALRGENPDVPPADLLAAVQTLLDRVLFIAFAEDRGLLPADTLKAAFAHADPYNPKPVWENFRGLFRAVDEGRERLRIPRYNGGLFAENTLLDDRLVVPDTVCRGLAALGKWEYRPPSEATSDDPDAKPIVDVDVLGHIFEQSITDLERLREEAVSGTAPARAKNDTRSRRKREGAFYTPAFVTNYIVNEALGGVLRDQFEALREHHRSEATAPTRGSLDDPAAYDADVVTPARREVLIRFWEAWQAKLSRVRVIDPACGSGAFLVEAFDQLHRHYEDVNGHLAALRGQPELYDLDRHILQRNLYGVDLNGEAVEIAKLSLWIKTARRGQVLTDLDGTIKAGNSVVNDPGVDARAFDWRREFADVFADGGFDAAIMNPPYVRQELLGPIKPHLESRFRSYHGMADLYTYFFELALDLLKPGGRLGAIVTNKWLRSGYAQPLRRHLAEASWVESLVDFGHAKQIFPQADVFPAILVAQKPAEGRARPAPRVAVIPREQLRIDDLARQVAADAFETRPEMLAPEGWSLEPPGVAALMERIAAAGIPL